MSAMPQMPSRSSSRVEDADATRHPLLTPRGGEHVAAAAQQGCRCSNHFLGGCLLDSEKLFEGRGQLNYPEIIIALWQFNSKCVFGCADSDFTVEISEIRQFAIEDQIVGGRRSGRLCL